MADASQERVILCRFSNLLDADHLTTVMGPACKAEVRDLGAILAEMKDNAQLGTMTQGRANQEAE
jgi:hypothetical protein